MTIVKRRTFFGLLGAAAATPFLKAARVFGMQPKLLHPGVVFTQISPITGVEASFVPQDGLPFSLSQPNIVTDSSLREISLSYRIHAKTEIAFPTFMVLLFDSIGTVKGGEVIRDLSLRLKAGESSLRDLKLSELMYVDPHGPFTKISVTAIAGITEGTMWMNALPHSEQVEYMRSGNTMPANITYQDYASLEPLDCGACTGCISLAKAFCGLNNVATIFCGPPNGPVCCSYTCGGGGPRNPPPSPPA